MKLRKKSKINPFSQKEKPTMKQERKVREEMDPEILEELKKHDFNRMFWEFRARPIRNRPEEFDIGQPDHIRMLSKRDRAWAEFIRKYWEKQAIRKSPRLIVA